MSFFCNLVGQKPYSVCYQIDDCNPIRLLFLVTLVSFSGLLEIEDLQSIQLFGSFGSYNC